MHKLMFVPISIVGCGKSTVFRTVRCLYPSFAHIENDNFENKPAFYHEVEMKLNDSSTNAILLDRNNHLVMHRKEIMQRFKSKNVTMVALLFVPKGTLPEEIRALLLDRIVLRGDNHQLVKGKTELGKAKMILNSFVKNFAQYDAKHPADKQFDDVIEMESGAESSEENVRRIVKFCNDFSETHRGIANFGPVSDEHIKEQFQRSLAFQVRHADEKTC